MEPVTRYRVKEAERAFRSETAELVFNYPQYDLEGAQELPDADRKLLLHYARLHRAELLQDLQAIVGSAGTKQAPKLATAYENSIKQLRKAL